MKHRRHVNDVTCNLSVAQRWVRQRSPCSHCLHYCWTCSQGVRGKPTLTRITIQQQCGQVSRRGADVVTCPPPHAASFIVRWVRPLWPRTPPKSPAKLNTLRQVAGRMRVGGCRCHCGIVGACCCAISIEIDNMRGCQSCRIGREFP